MRMNRYRLGRRLQGEGVHSTPYYFDYAKAVGGSGKRQLVDGSYLRLDTIGKLRRLRLPLPPAFTNLAWSEYYG